MDTVAESTSAALEGSGSSTISADWEAAAAETASVVAKGVGKLVKDTIYGLQKDVMKVAILAIAAQLYRAANAGSARRVPLLHRAWPQTGIALIVLAALGALRIMTRTDESGATLKSASPGTQVRAFQPLSIAGLLLAVFFIDRLDLFVGLQRVLAGQLSRFSDLVRPGLLKVLPFLRSTPPPPTRTNWAQASARALRHFVGASIVALYYALVFHLRRAAARAEEARLLLEAQQPLLKKVSRELRRAWCRCAPAAEKSLQIVSAVIGTGSALKYLVPRRR